MQAKGWRVAAEQDEAYIEVIAGEKFPPPLYRLQACMNRLTC
jgi:hypothetical protein